MWSEIEGQDAVPLTKCCIPPRRISSFTTKRPTLKFIPGLSRPEVDLYLRHEATLRKDLERLSRTPFTYKAVKDSDAVFDALTGIANYRDFLFVHAMIADSVSIRFDQWQFKSNVKNHTLLALMRLRLNIAEKDLAVRFNLPECIVWSTVEHWLLSLHTSIFQLTVTRFELSTTIQVRGYPVRLIIDIVEVCSAVDDGVRRDHMVQRNYPYKAVLGIRPDGQVCFASPLYSVYTSNAAMLNHCNVARYLRAGDTVVINPAYENALREVTSHLVDIDINCSKNRTAFGDVLDEVLPTLERRVEEIKQFQILSAIPHEWLQYGSAIWQVCATLCNFRV